MRTIQNKLVRRQPILDKRGAHQSHNKNQNPIWDRLKDFLKLIQSNESHYSNSRSNKRYFTNPELNLKKLYILFKNWLKEINRIESKFSLTAFKVCFNKYCNYRFRLPKLDKSHFCTEYSKHLSNVKSYQTLKKRLNQFK